MQTNEIISIISRRLNISPSLLSHISFVIQFNRGTSAMQHYVGLRPMFDVEVMNEDAKLVLGDSGSQPSPSNAARGLSSLYKEITGLNYSASPRSDERCVILIWFSITSRSDTVRKEAATITAVFPSPKDVMSILVQVFHLDCLFLHYGHLLFWGVWIGCIKKARACFLLTNLCYWWKSDAVRDY